MSCAQDLRALAAQIADVPAAASITAAAKIRDVALDNARAAAGGDLALTGKHSPIGLDVTVTEQAHPDGAAVTLKGTPAGPWVWIDTGTKPHRIPRRRHGRRSRVFVRHPGTTGKGAWADTITAAPDLAREATLDTLNRALT